MKLETAIKTLNKEANFLGLSLFEVLADAKKHGKMIYSDKVVQAADVFFTQILCDEKGRALCTVDH